MLASNSGALKHSWREIEFCGADYLDGGVDVQIQAVVADLELPAPDQMIV
jgi:hypothetical protein